MVQTFITQNKMENIATSVLEKAKKSTVWTGKVTRVDIDAIIEFTFGLTIDCVDLSKFSQDRGIVLAAISPEKKTIYMNSACEEIFRKKIGNRNFSLAHELGHWVLHVEQTDLGQKALVSDGEYFYCRDDSHSPKEIQANMFAAALLMPKNTIVRAGREIALAREEDRWTKLYGLADELEVSISALVRRAKELKVLYIKDKRVYASEDEANVEIGLF